MLSSLQPLFTIEQSPTYLAVLAVILCVVTATALLIHLNWRMSLLALAVQYVAVFLLVAGNWSVGMALVKLISGWIAGAVLVMALLGQPEQVYLPTGARQFFTAPLLALRVFYLLTAALVGLTALSLASPLSAEIPQVSYYQAVCSLFLCGMGLLQMGFTSQPLRTILGLLTALSGFEILYASVESSALVAGLLALVNLGLALVGAYLIQAPHMGDMEHSK
jgi:hypothetical protein